MKRVIQPAVLLLAFALRAGFVPFVRQDFDRAVPLANGLGALQAVLERNAALAPAAAFGTSVGLPNPPLANYFWALIALFDRSAFAATMVAAMLGVLAVAMTMSLAQRLLGRAPAWVAGALMAASPWSVFFGVATWLQGQLEFQAVCVCWLLLGGAAARDARRVFAAFVCGALFMQWYLPAMALLLLMATAGALVAGAALRRALMAGVLCGAISALAFVVPALTSSPISAASRVAPALTESATHGLGHALRLVSGRGFEVNQLYARYAAEVMAAPGYAPQVALGGARAWLIEALMLLGSVLLLAGAVKPGRSRNIGFALLLWMWLPAVLSMGLNIRDPSWLIHPHYSAITAPAGYLIASAPLALLQRRRPAQAQWAALLAVLLATATGAVRIANHTAYVRAYPWFRTVEHLPLADQTRLHAFLRGQCDQLVTDQDVRWTTSLWRDVRTSHTLEAALPDLGVARNGHYFRAHPPGERWCVAGAPPPVPGLQRLTMPMLNGELLDTWRTPALAATRNRDLASNIGWRLLALNAPARAARGGVARIEHIWQMEQLPAEPFATWYYAPFAKLFDSTGRQVLLVDGAPGLEGIDWRVGDQLDSVIALNIPASLAPGEYSLRLSLFDPNQRKNAAYFDAQKPGEPILELVLPLFVD